MDARQKLWVDVHNTLIASLIQLSLISFWHLTSSLSFLHSLAFIQSIICRIIVKRNGLSQSDGSSGGGGWRQLQTSQTEQCIVHTQHSHRWQMCHFQFTLKQVSYKLISELNMKSGRRRWSYRWMRGHRIHHTHSADSFKWYIDSCQELNIYRSRNDFFPCRFFGCV